MLNQIKIECPHCKKNIKLELTSKEVAEIRKGVGYVDDCPKCGKEMHLDKSDVAQVKEEVETAKENKNSSFSSGFKFAAGFIGLIILFFILFRPHAVIGPMDSEGNLLVPEGSVEPGTFSTVPLKEVPISNVQDNVRVSTQANSVCTPRWSCGSWSECNSSFKQVRYCYDENKCDSNAGKPSETRECKRDYLLGEEVQSGTFLWKVVGVSKNAQVGTYYGGYSSDESMFVGETADGIFYIIEVEVKNTGKSAEYLMDSFIKLLDDQGREFSADSTASYRLDDPLGFDLVNPGIVKKGKIAFDVPKDANMVKIKVSSSVIGDGFYTIKLIS